MKNSESPISSGHKPTLAIAINTLQRELLKYPSKEELKHLDSIEINDSSNEEGICIDLLFKLKK